MLNYILKNEYIFTTYLLDKENFIVRDNVTGHCANDLVLNGKGENGEMLKKNPEKYKEQVNTTTNNYCQKEKTMWYKEKLK